MRYLKILLYLFSSLGLYCGCSSSEVKSLYEEGYTYYTKGEIQKAVPCYVKCLYPFRNNLVSAYAYRDLAAICYQAGSYKMAYDINEKSVDRFRQEEHVNEYSKALCRSAIYNAYRGNNDEAIVQLRHVQVISHDSIIRNMANEYVQLLQENQMPLIVELQNPPIESELYNAVQLIKYELYRKPLIIKMVLIFFLFLLFTFIIYATHKGLLENLRKLYIEKKENKRLQIELSRKKAYQYQKQIDSINQYCEYLRAHPELLKKELQWSNYSNMRSIANMRIGNFFDKLEETATLNETEARLCLLVLIDYPRKVIADVLPYAPNSVGKLKNTVSKKLQTDGKNLKITLYEMLINAL